VRKKVIIVAAVVVVVITAGVDLLGPFSTDIRQFDADRIARLETDM
jgi:hypothetical protein